MKIAVVDGQGGGIGSAVIKRLREEFGESVQIIALGTNSIATAQMIKARANKGATGENAIIQTASKMDVIVGPIGIVLAQAMMGEVIAGHRPGRSRMPGPETAHSPFPGKCGNHGVCIGTTAPFSG